MSGEEMKRAMESLRQAQANFEAEAGLDSSFRDSIRETTASQLRTDELLSRLANAVERLITEGRNGNSQQ
jgi:hypothetical protein